MVIELLFSEFFDQIDQNLQKQNFKKCVELIIEIQKQKIDENSIRVYELKEKIDLQIFKVIDSINQAMLRNKTEPNSLVQLISLLKSLFVENLAINTYF